MYFFTCARVRAQATYKSQVAADLAMRKKNDSFGLFDDDDDELLSSVEKGINCFLVFSARIVVSVNII